ncbi:odorant receptor 94a-like [Bradysia coprophila]|uniref:odorant receptor 94a-like n=1 Tax=Bradysia coprophila TaxID=38358 RepID=UPI00187DA2D5|nr:odorant receptor 94a-like [Bradysia coprophila]
MYSTEIHKGITLLISLFYFIGIWHRGDRPTARELKTKIFYSIYHPLFIISIVVGGASGTKSIDAIIFLAETSLAVAVLTIKFWLLIWKQNEIRVLLNRVCEFTIRNDDDYVTYNAKLKGFIKFVMIFLVAVIVNAVLVSLGVPIITSENSLFLEIGFPLDWKNSEAALGIATIFILSELILSAIAINFSVIIWYLLLTCSLRYDVMGSELTNMGRASEETIENMTERDAHRNFFEELKAVIDAYRHLRDLTSELGSYFSNIIFVQFSTSGLCICGSVYCLAFDVGDSLLESLIHIVMFFYFTSDLFMITYFGNEIMLSSDSLSYSLFESNWIEQPQSTKKCVIIFGEYVKQPQILLIAKLYPLTLETFTKIMNSAYSMFNISKNFK